MLVARRKVQQAPLRTALALLTPPAALTCPTISPRQIDHCGPVSMFQKLLSRWQGSCSAAEVAAKVQALPTDSSQTAYLPAY